MTFLHCVCTKLSWFFVVCLFVLSQFSVYGIEGNLSFKNPKMIFLQEKVKYVEFEFEAVEIITEILGKPDRYLGSGNPVPQWDIEGGFLTCCELGITYSKNKEPNIFDKDTVFLVNTINRVDENLIKNFLFCTLPAQGDFPIGTLELKPNGQYQFGIELSSFEGDFFIDHPEGTYWVEYQNGVKSNDFLEDLKDQTIFAKVNFQAKDNGEIYSVYFGVKHKGIFTKPAPGYKSNYKIIGYRKNYYYKPSGPSRNPSIDEFTGIIKHARNDREAYAIIRKNYGEGQFVNGYYQWNVDGGILQYHHIDGVCYLKSGQKLHLIETKNVISKTIIGDYEMYALTTDNEKRIKEFLLTWLSLEANGQYNFKTFNKKNKDIFFIRYPTGKYTIEYEKGINPNGLLEQTEEGTKIARIIFLSETAQKAFYVYTGDRIQIMKPTDNEQTDYALIRAWRNYYENDGN